VTDERKAHVRVSGPVEGLRGNREVPPTKLDGPRADEAEVEEQETDEAVDELAAVTAERDDYLDALQRLKAEFDNYRKRAARDQDALAARASERLVVALLPVLDDLGRALEAAESHEEATKSPARDSGPVVGARGNREVSPRGDVEGAHEVFEGVRLVERALADALAREGLLEIETDGKFDPNVHEALLAQPAEAESGTVLDVVQKGYRLGDRVLRPARVIVAQ
jgi:molecular chaperone GrpE